MTGPADDVNGTPADPEITLDDLWLEFGDQWDITLITGGYRALIHGTGGCPSVPLYGRTPSELAESIRMAERQL
jgi:hypothetical protein